MKSVTVFLHFYIDVIIADGLRVGFYRVFIPTAVLSMSWQWSQKSTCPSWYSL